MRQFLAHPSEHLHVFADGVAPLHPQEHVVGAVLRGHVQVVTDLRQVADGRDQVGRHVPRVIGDELDPVEAGHAIELREQVGEPRRLSAVSPPVAVDGLTDERDLAAALGDEFLRFRDDRIRRPRLLRPAHPRHHAERAEFVAARLRPHEGLKRRRPHGRIAVGIIALETAGDRLAAAPLAVEAHLQLRTAASKNSIDEPGHLVQLPGADDEVDPRRPRSHERLVLLGHAAEDADDEAGSLFLLEPNPTERRVDLVLGMLPHAAGVVEDRVGIGLCRRQLPALPAERRHHELAVEHVHLAADGFDPEPLGHGHGKDSTISGISSHLQPEMLRSRIGGSSMSIGVFARLRPALPQNACAKNPREETSTVRLPIRSVRAYANRIPGRIG